MNKKEKDLSDLKSYTEEIDKELTLILQSIQWDRQHLLQGKPLVKCKYDPGHRIPEEIKDKHEEQCFVKMQGYCEEDVLLPEPPHPLATTLVKLSNTDIRNIINIAATSDPYLQRGVGCDVSPQPLSLSRLQATYSTDERRAIHNAVVASVPACHDLTDLTLPSNDEPSSSQPKSRLEILTELRNMKRRRMKYRVASKSRNYSDVLRDVIKSQMELNTGVKSEPITIKPEPDMPTPMKIKQEYSSHDYEEDTRYGEETYTHREVKRERDVIEERVRIKREPEERYDRRDRDREYSKDKYRRQERDRNGKSRDGERRRHNDEYRHERDRRHEGSKDRRKEERYDRHDKKKSNGSHSYSDVKESKRRRHYDSYDDYDDRRRR